MTDQTAERDQYARAIREAVRIRLGTNALRLAEEGRPVMLNMSEAEAAADAVLAVRDTARQAAGQTPTTEQPPMDPAAALHAAANKIESHAWFSEGTAYDNGRDGAIEWAVAFLRSMADEATAGVRDTARQAAGQPADEPSARSPKKVVFAAVYAHIHGLAPDYVPSSVVERNASIWRAVHAALAALSDAAAERPAVGQPAEAQPADRAAILREAADALNERGKPTCEPDGDCCWYDAVAELRRMAVEETR